MLNKSSHRLISIILSVALLATLFITAAVSPTAAEGETTNLLSELKINPSVWSIDHDFSWNETAPDYSGDTYTREVTYDNSSSYKTQWPLLYDGLTTNNQVSGFMAGNASAAHNNTAWSRRVAIMYDLGSRYNLSDVEIWSRTNNSKNRSIYRYSVYGSNAVDGILQNKNLLGRYSSTDKNIVKAGTTLNSTKSVQYVMIVFDCVANDPGNTNVTHDYSETNQTVISQDRLVNALPGFGSAADGGIYIEEVILEGTPGKPVISILGNGTENNNKGAKVYQINHTVDYSVSYPDYSNDTITEKTAISNVWSSQIKTDGTGTFTAAPADAASYANILTDGIDLSDNTSARTNEAWIGGSSGSKAVCNARRLALFYDLGGKYTLENVDIAIPGKHNKDKRYIHAFSVYGSDTPDVEAMLDNAPIGTGGGKVAKVSAEITSATPVRFILIVFNVVGTDYFVGDNTTNSSFTASDFCSSLNGVVYLSEITVKGYAAENVYSTNILANNASATLSAYTVGNVKFDWTKANQDYSEATVKTSYTIQRLNGAAVKGFAANDVNSKFTNGNKVNFANPAEQSVGSDNANDLTVLGENRGSLTETRQGLLIDLGAYYKLDSMHMFGTPNRFNQGRTIYDYTVFAGNTSDVSELLASENVSHGSSRTLAIGNTFASGEAVRYLFVVFDRVGTDPTTDYNGVANTLPAKIYNGLVYITELEVYGEKMLGSASADGPAVELGANNAVTVTVPEGKWLKAGSLYYTVGDVNYPIVYREGSKNSNGSFNLNSESNSSKYVFTLPSNGGATVSAEYVDIGAKNMAVLATSATTAPDSAGKVKLRWLSRVYKTYIEDETTYTLANCGTLLFNAATAGTDVSALSAEQLEAYKAEIEAGNLSFGRVVPTKVLYDRCEDYVEYTAALKFSNGSANLGSTYVAYSYAEYKDENGESVMLYSDNSRGDSYNAVIADYEDGTGNAAWYRTRNGLTNTYSKLTNDKKLNVVFIGGSITFGIGVENTETNSYPARVTSWLKSQYPDAEINMLKAAIGGAGSEWGAYCVDEDVLGFNPDLVFVEYSVNDEISIGEGKYDYDESAAYYETFIRKIRKASPKCDVVSIYTVNGYYVDKIEGSNGPEAALWYPAAARHDQVADYYDVPSVSIGYRLCKEIKSISEIKRNYLYDGTHATDAGYAKYADYMKEFLQVLLNRAASASVIAESKNPCPADYFNTAKADMIEGLMNSTYEYVKSIDQFDSTTGWENPTGTAWKGEGRFYNYRGCGITSKDAPVDNELVYTFTGSNFGLFAQLNNKDLSLYNADLIKYYPEGFDYNRTYTDFVEWYIYDEEAGITSFDAASAAGVLGYASWANYPLMLAEGLEYGEHTIHIRWNYQDIIDYNNNVAIYNEAAAAYNADPNTTGTKGNRSTIKAMPSVAALFYN